MYTRDAVAYFGSKANIVKTLANRSKPAIYQWGAVVPLEAARELEAHSGGDLKVDRTLYTPSGRIIRKPTLAEGEAA